MFPLTVNLILFSDLLEEQDMMWVYLSNYAVDSAVKIEQSRVLLIGRLVERIISGDPYVVAVSLRSVALKGYLTLARCCHSTTARS